MRLFKKIAAGALGALMVGATLGLAQLDSFPSPFVTSSGVQSLVVVGASAAPSDVVGAVDIAARLGGEVTTTVSCPGSSGAISISGEGKEIATTNTKFYLNDTLRKTGARTTFTSTELPTILKSDTLEDSDASTTYNYDQYIDLSANYSLKFAQHVPENLVTTDPELVLKHGGATGISVNPSTPSTTDYMYKTRVVFEKGVNATTAASESIKILGKTYTISSTSDVVTSGSEKFVLYGSANTQVLTEKETVTITIEGVDHEVTLEGVSDTTTAVITVDSTTKSVTSGSTYTIAGLKVYVEDVFYYGSTRTDNQAKLGLGASEITFQDTKKVTLGSGGSTTNIDGTYVDLSMSNTKLDILEVYVVPAKTSMDALKKGESFVDPVFGTFNIDFVSATPEYKDSSRSILDISPSGDDSLTATFTDVRGNTNTFTWAYDADSISLEDSSGYPYIVSEGHRIYQNNHFILDAGDFSHMLTLSDIDNDGSSTGSIEFTDVFSGTIYQFTLGSNNYTTAYIDGQAYYVNGTVGTTFVQLYWGDNAALTGIGNEYTVYPMLKGHNGEYIALMNETVIAAQNATLVLPTGKVTMSINYMGDTSPMLNFTAYTGYSLSINNTDVIGHLNLSSAANETTIKVGKTSTGGFYYQIKPTSANNIRITPAGSDGVVYQGGEEAESIILVEEQDSASNVYHVAVQASNETSGSIVQIIAAAPDFTAVEESAAMKSDTYKTQYVDLYGVFAERNTYGQDTVKIYYPDEQMTANLVVLAEGATVSTAGGTTGGTVEQAVPITTALGKLDTEVTSGDKQTKNLILVGGPAVNTLVAELGTDGKHMTLQDYRNKGAGFAIIDYIADAFTSGKAAIVVAGHSAADTRAAANIVQQYDTKGLSGSEVEIMNGVITTIS